MGKLLNFIIGGVIVIGGLSLIRKLTKPPEREIRIAKQPITITNL